MRVVELPSADTVQWTHFQNACHFMRLFHPSACWTQNLGCDLLVGAATEDQLNQYINTLRRILNGAKVVFTHGDATYECAPSKELLDLLSEHTK